MYTVLTQKTGIDLWALPLDGDKKPFPVLQSAFDEMDAQFSPDGRWIAYESKVFDTRYYNGGSGRAYDISPDGQRFLMIKNAGTEQGASMVVVLNWLEELKAKLPAK